MAKKSQHSFVGKNFVNESFKDAVKNFSFISKCKFKDCDFSFASFKEAKIFETEFENCNFFKTHFDASGFKDVKIINCSLDGTFYSSTNFRDVIFSKCLINNVKLRGTSFKDSIIENFSIVNSDLNRSIYEYCTFKDIIFEKCKMFMFMCFKTNLSGVHFNNSNLTLSKFISCDKKNTVFSDNNKMLCMFKKDSKI